jgi:hypothetical protein
MAFLFMICIYLSFKVITKSFPLLIKSKYYVILFSLIIALSFQYFIKNIDLIKSTNYEQMSEKVFNDYQNIVKLFIQSFTNFLGFDLSQYIREEKLLNLFPILIIISYLLSVKIIKRLYYKHFYHSVIIVSIFANLSVYEFEISDNYFMNYLQKCFFIIDKRFIKREALVLLLVVITIFYVILVKIIKTIIFLLKYLIIKVMITSIL